MSINSNLKASGSEVEQAVAVGFDPVQLPDSSQRLVQLVEIGRSEVVSDVDLGWRDGPKWPAQTPTEVEEYRETGDAPDCGPSSQQHDVQIVLCPY